MLHERAEFRRLSSVFDGFPPVFSYYGRNSAIRFKFHASRTSVQLALNLLQSAQRKLAKAHHQFEVNEDGLDRLLTQDIERSSRLGLQAMRLHGDSILRQRCRFSPVRVVLVASHRDYWIDTGRLARLNVLLALQKLLSAISSSTAPRPWAYALSVASIRSTD